MLTPEIHYQRCFSCFCLLISHLLILTTQHGGGHGNPLQYSCLENLMDKGAWWALGLWDLKESDMTEVT